MRVKYPRKRNETICRKNYIDPYLIDTYLNDTKRFYGTFKHAETREEITDQLIVLLKSK